MGIDAGLTATGIVVVELVPYDLLPSMRDRVVAAVTVRTAPDARRKKVALTTGNRASVIT